MQPTPENQRKAEELFALLSSEDFSERQDATIGLENLGISALEIVRKGVHAKDPEIQARCKGILSRSAAGQGTMVLQAALSLLKSRVLNGSLPVILNLIPSCPQSYLLNSFHDALRNQVRTDDKPGLMEALRHNHTDVRIAAVEALGKLWGAEGSATMKDVAQSDQSDPVRLAAVRQLALQGNRDCVKMLIDLLPSKDMETRTNSVVMLWTITECEFGFISQDPENPKSSAALNAWRNWLEKESANAKLKLPLKENPSCRGNLNGNALLALGHKNEVKEVAPDGTVVWKYQANGAWCAEKLIGGNVLICSFNNKKLIEVNRAGDIVWEFPIGCLNAKPLPNGNFLVADYSDNRAIEVNRDKQTVWAFKTADPCCDVQRLRNGNTVVLAGVKVTEVDPSGKTVWEWDASVQPYGFQRLENGNTLVALFSSDKVVEITPTKEIVWEYPLTNPSDVYRLPNGNTLMTGKEKAIEVTPDKKVIRTYEGFQYGSARK